ncbi:COP23 domain-containing protein [Microcoleus sp. B5-C4]|uniref:COP23 domain-containing protein n=1 Tax=Microcoleus sp. B5-C4 TaxID=2818675 RepID=UPI002FD2C848
MKKQIERQLLTVLAGAIAIGSLAVSPKPSQSQSTSGFMCDASSGSPATVYQNRQGVREVWINWVSDYFRDSGYDPMTRCREVSGRLETYRQNKQLKYVTVGYMNGQRVICTASKLNGRCDGLIYTLKPGQDSIRTLYQFMGLGEGQAGASTLSESGDMPYIDARPRLGEEGGNSVAPPAPANNRPAPANNQPVPQQPTGGGMREL